MTNCITLSSGEVLNPGDKIRGFDPNSKTEFTGTFSGISEAEHEAPVMPDLPAGVTPLTGPLMKLVLTDLVSSNPDINGQVFQAMAPDADELARVLDSLSLTKVSAE